jgi:hypothetical protein
MKVFHSSTFDEAQPDSRRHTSAVLQRDALLCCWFVCARKHVSTTMAGGLIECGDNIDIHEHGIPPDLRDTLPFS